MAAEHVRFEGKADIPGPLANVRFDPKRKFTWIRLRTGVSPPGRLRRTSPITPAAAPPVSLVGQGVVGTGMPAVTGVKTTKVTALLPPKRSSVITVHAVPAPSVSKITLRLPGPLRPAVCLGFGNKRAACEQSSCKCKDKAQCETILGHYIFSAYELDSPISASHLSSFYAADAKPCVRWLTNDSETSWRLSVRHAYGGADRRPPSCANVASINVECA
jgi:hypothetical protein